ncbi:ATP-binding protein [Desulfovermiculus halophilus]|uniref:ATP-binding protein n=1 Tax=Desulfovermiculus halophilus TaxID=339722 RepID=UPI00048369D9|nr:ATP-binding protein [Desulfovermiculus halophilus]
MRYSSQSHKSNIFYIRLTAIISLAYMLVFEPGNFETKVWAYLYIAFFLSTNLVLSALPKWIYSQRRFYNLLVCFDTIMIALGIYLVGQVETSFFLIYFFIIGIASLSTNFRYLMVNTAMFVLIYGWIMYSQGNLTGDTATMYTLRLPFIFAVSLLFGYIIDALLQDINKELRDSEEKFRSLVQSIEGYVFMLDRQGVVISANRALSRHIGLPDSKIIGRQYDRILPQSLTNDLRPSIDSVMASQTPAQFDWHDPEYDRWYLTSLHPVFDSSTKDLTAVSVVAKDTTKRVHAEQELRTAYERLQKTQEQLIQKSKMETMGRLSSGIAHQLRNPLEIILMGTEFVENQMDQANKQLVQGVQKIKQAVYRANNIVEDFLRFSKSANFQLSSLSICSLLQETEQMIEHKLRQHNVHFELHCPDGSLAVQANRNALQQVFLNLFTNAIEAQGTNGRISVAVDGQPREEDRARERGVESPTNQSWVVVEVADQGPGMDEKQVSNIFEPFYSTKQGGNGSGLGLSIAKMIIDTHQGKIEVQSEPQQGTRFQVYLQPA